METTLTQTQATLFNKVIDTIKQNLQAPLEMANIESRLISLSGAAGVGKSYLVAQITKQILIELNLPSYTNSDDYICITAPTHKAVQVISEMVKEQQLRISCKTLHSFLKLLQVYDNDTGEERYIQNRFNEDVAKVDILIVDESSMVPKYLFNFILNAVESGRINTVLFVGDSYQLPPVKENKSLVFQLEQNELTEIVRQAQDSDIIKLATRFRDRIATQNFCNFSDNFKNIESEDIQIFTDSNLFFQNFCKNDEWYNENNIIASYSNNDVCNINKDIRTKFWQAKGVTNPDYILKDDTLRFKSSFSTNGTVASYQNGEEVMIKSATLEHNKLLNIYYWKCTVLERDDFNVIDPSSINHFISILAKYKKEALRQPKKIRKRYWKKYYVLKDSFANIQYIFASTIHKLQGSTYDTVYIDFKSLKNYRIMSDNMKYRLAYVAITRARYKIKILL